MGQIFLAGLKTRLLGNDGETFGRIFFFLSLIVVNEGRAAGRRAVSAQFLSAGA